MDEVVVLQSGGLDSAVILSIAKKYFLGVHSLSFKFEEKGSKEITCSRLLADHYSIEEHKVIESPLKEIVGVKDIDSNYMPLRNLVMLSYAASYAERIGAEFILIGANAHDIQDYPDCSEDFLQHLQETINLGSKLHKRIKVIHPLKNLEKKKIVEIADERDVPFEKTWSCYFDGRVPCGRCNSCQEREEAFEEADIKDPLIWGDS